MGLLALIRREAAEARHNVNVFGEFVIRDESGDPIRQSHIHASMHAHVDWCQERGLFCGIAAPWGHGKTEQIVVLRVLRMLGERPNLRIKVVCNTADNAMIRVDTIGKYIEESKELHLVYPELQRDPKGDWSKHRLVVKRKSRSKDASVEGWGLFSGGIGGRADVFVFDDVCDMKDIVEPTIRDKRDQFLHNTWLSRLKPGGQVIYIATAWHDKDLTHRLLRNPRWSFLWMAVSSDYRAIDCTLYNADEHHPLLHSGLALPGTVAIEAAGEPEGV